MYDIHNHYEVHFDVPSGRHDAFEEWLSSNVVEWINHESVAHFEVFRNDTSLSPEVKFVFGFETLRDWASFVNSDEHRAAMDRFETLADNREAVLWQPASVKLDGTDASPVGDGGKDEATGRTRGTDPVIPQ